ncbi:MAG: ATP-binding cassette domain-containing protein [Candidatus Hodarchaeota archaeon]
MSKTTISINNVWFRYPGTKNYLLKSFTWNREESGIVGLVGTNGSGKTTLIKLIAGIIKPAKGTIQINHKTIKGINYTKNIVTYVPENAKLFLIGSTPRKDLSRIITDHKTVDELINQYGFEEIADKKLYHLSEGQRRLIAFFNASQLSKSILLFDEPSIGMDSKGRLLFFNLLRKMAKQGKIIIIASNDPRIFSQMDELLVIREGSLYLHGHPREILYRLEEETELIPNQIVRLIRSLKIDVGCDLPHYLSVDELNEVLRRKRRL